MKTRAHILFEQSNTFRDAMRRLGFAAESYDLPGTGADRGCDLMEGIRRRAAKKPGVLDGIGAGDWVFAFFPCIYFSMGGLANWAMAGKVRRNGSGGVIPEEYIEGRRRKRAEYLERFRELLAVAEREGWRLVVENPASSLARSGLEPLPPCSFRIQDRSVWGDIYAKPTAFWMVGVEVPAMFPPFDVAAADDSRKLRDHIRHANARRNEKRSGRDVTHGGKTGLAHVEPHVITSFKPTGGIGNGIYRLSKSVSEKTLAKVESGELKPEQIVRSRHYLNGALGAGFDETVDSDCDALADLRRVTAEIKDPGARRMLVRSYIHPRFAETFCGWITGRVNALGGTGWEVTG